MIYIFVEKGSLTDIVAPINSIFEGSCNLLSKSKHCLNAQGFIVIINPPLFKKLNYKTKLLFTFLIYKVVVSLKMNTNRIYVSNLLCDGTERKSNPSHFINKLPQWLEITESNSIVKIQQMVITLKKDSEHPTFPLVIFANFVSPIICGSNYGKLLGLVSPNLKTNGIVETYATQGIYNEIEIWVEPGSMKSENEVSLKKKIDSVSIILSLH